jgi:hypothetical protein
VIDEILSRAVVAYLGKEWSPFPRSDVEAVSALAEDDLETLIARFARSRPRPWRSRSIGRPARSARAGVSPARRWPSGIPNSRGRTRRALLGVHLQLALIMGMGPVVRSLKDALDGMPVHVRQLAEMFRKHGRSQQRNVTDIQ